MFWITLFRPPKQSESLAVPHLESANRRTHERLDLKVAVTQQGAVAGHSEDLSVGGAKIRWCDPSVAKVGDTIEVAVALPGRAPLRAEAEVRWRGDARTCGVAFDKRTQAVLASFFAAMCGLTSATASAAAAVPTFDPDADVVIEDTGSERPDEHTIELAFKKQNDALNACVTLAGQAGAKGDAKLEVLLNPQGDRPLGINATLPDGLQNNTDFRECVRGATAAAPFPSYDGPPVVVDLDFELDPGHEIEEEW